MLKLTESLEKYTTAETIPMVAMIVIENIISIWILSITSLHLPYFCFSPVVSHDIREEIQSAINIPN
jgi:hypothetical protein